MTIHPFQEGVTVQEAQVLPERGQAENSAAADSAGISTPYDTIWTGQGVPQQQPEGIERTMLAEDKLYVVLAVVLIIWVGLALFVFRTDRRIERLERKLDQRIAEVDAG